MKLKKLLEFAESCGPAETIFFYNEVCIHFLSIDISDHEKLYYWRFPNFLSYLLFERIRIFYPIKLINFVNDDKSVQVKRFQRLPARSAEQFNFGQAIYDRYLKDESTILL